MGRTTGIFSPATLNRAGPLFYWYVRDGQLDYFSGDHRTWDEEGEAHMYQPVNQACSDSGENAPVDIGGQTPVLKRNALDDLRLAAECVLHFAKTGAMYPGLQWEEFE